MIFLSERIKLARDGKVDNVPLLHRHYLFYYLLISAKCCDMCSEYIDH